MKTRILVLNALVLLSSIHPATAQTTYTPYTFTTIAGLAHKSGSADGTGSTARFYWPDGMAVNSAGNLFVADTGNYTIRQVTSAGVVTTLAGSAGISGTNDGTGSAARFGGYSNDSPCGGAMDSTGNLYVADTSNCTIRKVTPAGVVTTVAGLARWGGSDDGVGSAALFLLPRGVAVDSAGNVFVADTGNNTIRQVSSAGVVTTLAGSAGQAGSADGTGSAARFNAPIGVAVDSVGNVFVADSKNYTIRQVSSAGVVTTLAGSAGASGRNDGTGSAALFWLPRDVAVDSAGNVFVADSGNNTIRKVTPAGVVTTLAGLAGKSGSADGTGSAAQFNIPGAVAVDRAGNVFVADTLNHTIRKGSPAVTLGIDVSHYQNENTSPNPINWGSVKNAGNSFVFVKASEGISSNENPQGTNPDGISYTASNVQGATGAGLLVGVYHLAHPDLHPSLADAENEAVNFINQGGSFTGNGFLPPALDLESDYGLDKPTLSQWLRTWLQYVECQQRVRPILYTIGFVARYLLEDDLKTYPLWIVTDDGNPSGPPTYSQQTWLNPPDWAFKQYRRDLPNGCPGITGNIDLDSFNGTLDALQALTIHASSVRFTGVGGGAIQPPKDGVFQLEISAPCHQIIVQVSDDLATWTDLATVPITGGKGTLTDASAGGQKRFYRQKP
jgi:GH25 family lysozyme M1 (1,4-beta-N-acetylmuramidase)